MDKQAENNIKKEVVLINNPDYLQTKMWNLVVEFTDMVPIQGVSAHSMMTALLYGTQSRELELWGAIRDNECIGFIGIQTAGPPYYSMAIAPYMYMKEKDEELVSQLYQKVVDYMKKRQLKYFTALPMNKKLADHFTKIAKSYDFKYTGHGYCYHFKRNIVNKGEK